MKEANDKTKKKIFGKRKQKKKSPRKNTQDLRR